MSGTREALVGVVIVVAVLVTVVGTLWLQGTSWGRAERDLEAIFFEVGMTRPGNALKLRGVEVGRVREIAVDPSGEVVRISFRIAEDVVLPLDPVVILSPESMFGDWQAEIHQRGRFPQVSYTQPREPGVLPGHALPDISQLTFMADQISGNLAVMTERIGIAFSDETARNIASLIENVEEVTDRLSDLVSQQAGSFVDVTEGVQRATDEIGQAAEQARVTFQRVDELIAMEQIASTIEDLAVVSGNLRELSGELQGTNEYVRHAAQQADATLSRLDEIVTRAADGEGSLGRLLQDPAMTDQLEAMVVDMRELLVDIRENPRRYVRLSIF